MAAERGLKECLVHLTSGFRASHGQLDEVLNVQLAFAIHMRITGLFLARGYGVGVSFCSACCGMPQQIWQDIDRGARSRALKAERHCPNTLW